MKKEILIPLLALPAIWGGYYVASRQALLSMPVFATGIVIRALTMLLLTAMMAWRGELRQLFQVRYVWKWLCAIGVFGFLLDTTAFIGLQMSPAGIGTALLKCDIIFINLISVYLYKERFTIVEWLLSFIMLFGVFLVLDIDFVHIELFNAGNIFFILSALFVSINAFLIKEAQKHPKNPASNNVIAYYNNFITMLFFVAASIHTGQLPALAGDGYSVALFLAGLGQTLIYVVYYYNLRHNPVWLVKILLLLMPIVAAGISYVLFDEVMNTLQFLGLCIVLIGSFFILLLHDKERSGSNA